MSGNQFDQLILNKVRILELIDHHIAETMLQRLKEIRIHHEELMCLREDIIEIHLVVHPFPLLIFEEDAPRFLFGFRPLRKLTQIEFVQFIMRELGKERLRIIGILDVHPALDLLQQDLFVPFIADDFLRILSGAQKMKEEGMECTGMHPVSAFGSWKTGDPLLHLIGSLLREGHQQDMLGFDPLHRHQIAGPAHKDRRLTRPCTSKGQARPSPVTDGFDLRLIQLNPCAL